VAVPKIRLRTGDLRSRFSLSWVEPDDLHLRHIAEVNPPFFINVDLQTALSDLAERFVERGTPLLAGFGIELPNDLELKSSTDVPCASNTSSCGR